MKSLALTFLSIVGFIPLIAQSDVQVYPNPFEDEFYFIGFPQCADSISIEIFNIIGETVFKEHTKVYQADTLQYELKGLSKAVFIIRYNQGDQEFMQKLIHTGNDSLARMNLVLSSDNLDCTHKPFEVFPNPSKDGKFTIRQLNTSLDYELIVYDIRGRVVEQKKLTNRKTFTFNLDLSSKRDGLYIFRLVSSEGEEVKKALLLQEK